MFQLRIFVLIIFNNLTYVGYLLNISFQLLSVSLLPLITHFLHLSFKGLQFFLQYSDGLFMLPIFSLCLTSLDLKPLHLGSILPFPPLLSFQIIAHFCFMPFNFFVSFDEVSFLLGDNAFKSDNLIQHFFPLKNKLTLTFSHLRQLLKGFPIDFLDPLHILLIFFDLSLCFELFPPEIISLSLHLSSSSFILLV